MNLRFVLCEFPSRLFLFALKTVLCAAPLFGEEEPWAPIDQEAKAIEDRLIAGDYAEALVLSASAMFAYRETPAFYDISQSVFHGYAGRPVAELETLLSARSNQSSEQPGLAWLDTGLLAKACWDHHETVHAFQKALEDELCCRIPMSYVLLGEACAKIRWASSTYYFQEAISAASQDPELQFQARRIFAITMMKQGNIDAWRGAFQAAATSTYPLERAWSFERQAQDAWWRNDMEAFAQNIAHAVSSASPYDASTPFQWKWLKNRFNVLSEHLQRANAYLSGSTRDGVLFDYDAAMLDVYRKDYQAALDRIEPWLFAFHIEEIDQWEPRFLLWGQRIHLLYNYLLAHLGRQDEAVAGFQSMIPFARDTDVIKFEPHLHLQLGYALKLAGRLHEARQSMETALAYLDVADQVADPEVGYCQGGRIATPVRMDFTLVYRRLLNRIAQMEAP